MLRALILSILSLCPILAFSQGKSTHLKLIHDFEGNNFEYSVKGMVGANDSLYVLCSTPDRHGMLFRIDENGDGYKVIWKFDGAFSEPNSIANDDKSIYITTRFSGNQGGAIFKYSLEDYSFTLVKDFPYTEIQEVNIKYVTDSVLWFTSLQSMEDFGSLFTTNLDGTDLKKIYSCKDAEVTSMPSNFFFHENKIYIAFYGGGKLCSLGGSGSAYCGSFVRINMDGTGYENIIQGSDEKGQAPQSIVIRDNKLIGLFAYSYNGNMATGGQIFRSNLDGSDYEPLGSTGSHRSLTKFLSTQSLIYGVSTSSIYGVNPHNGKVRIYDDFQSDTDFGFDVVSDPVYLNGDVFITAQQAGPNGGGTILKWLNARPELNVPDNSSSRIATNTATEIDLHALFVDPNGDDLSFSYEYNPELVTVSESEGLLNLIPLTSEDADVKITATDGWAGYAGALIKSNSLTITEFVPSEAVGEDPGEGTGTTNTSYKYEDVINAERVGHLQLNQPYGIATGKEGRIYMSEPYFNQIVILNSSGSHYKTVSLANHLQLDYVLAIDVAQNGNIYVSTYYKILVLDSEGNFLNEIIHSTNSTQPFYVYDIAVDSQGKIYVASLSGGILIFSESGELMGNIPDTPYVLVSLAVTSNDDLLALDYYNNRVVRFRGGVFFDEPIQLLLPMYISVDAQDNIYIQNYIFDGTNYEPQLNYYNSQLQLQNVVSGVDQVNSNENYKAYFFYGGHISAADATALNMVNPNSNELVRVNMVSGNVTTLVRSDWSGQVNGPKELSTDSFGNVYVVDGVDGINQRYRIQVFDYKGNYIKEWKSGNIGPNYVKLKIDGEDNVYVTTYGGITDVYNLAGELQSSLNTYVLDFTADGTYYYVLGIGENLIKVYSKQGELIRVIPDNPGWEDDEINPVAIEVTPSGNLIVAKYGELLVFANDGTFIKTIGSYGHEDGQFAMINALQLDDAGFIYVGDYSTVQIFDSEGNFLQKIGSVDFNDPESFWTVSGVAVKNGRLYVSNLYSNEVRIYSKLPAVQVADVQLNYKDWYHFLPQETTSGNRITYKIKEGIAASLSFDNMLDLNNAGEVIIEASVDASASMSKSSDEFVVFIDKAKLSLKAQNKERAYGDANPEFSIQSPYYSAIVDGLRGDDDLIEIDELPIITTDANVFSPVGEYPISFVGGNDNNYDFEFTSGTLTVTKAPLQLIADNQEKQYGDADPTFTFQAIGFKNNDVVQDLDSAPLLTATATLTSPADTYPITFNVGLDNNYYIIPANGNLTVTKAPLQVKAQNATRAYGEPNPSFAVSFEGFKNNDTQDILVGIPTPYSDAVSNSPVGQYPIVFGNNSDSRYEYITASATLTIEKGNQQISFNDLPSPIDSDADPFSVGPYASVTSNLPITFSITSGPATINGMQVTLTGQGGTVTVNATQAGNSNYNAAEPVSKSFEVNLITDTNEEPGSLKIYPNPAKDALWISSAEGVKFQLLNTNGIPVVQYTNSFVADHVVSTESLPKGIYLLVLQTTRGNKVTRKISVIK